MYIIKIWISFTDFFSTLYLFVFPPFCDRNIIVSQTLLIIDFSSFKFDLMDNKWIFLARLEMTKL